MFPEVKLPSVSKVSFGEKVGIENSIIKKLDRISNIVSDREYYQRSWELYISLSDLVIAYCNTGDVEKADYLASSIYDTLLRYNKDIIARKLFYGVRYNKYAYERSRTLGYRFALAICSKADAALAKGAKLTENTENLESENEIATALTSLPFIKEWLGFFRSSPFIEINKTEAAVRSMDVPSADLLGDNLRIRWNGTPGEFGAIMTELIDKGFISKKKDLKTTVSFLANFFEVKTEKGNPANEKYLYKCFNEKMRHYNRSELVIPESDNSGKK